MMLIIAKIPRIDETEIIMTRLELDGTFVEDSDTFFVFKINLDVAWVDIWVNFCAALVVTVTVEVGEYVIVAIVTVYS